MVTGLFHIRLNSDEENKDSGFYALITSGTSIACLKNEEFIIPAEAVNKLNEKKIKYEIVPEKRGISKKCEEKPQNASEVKI
ncbi:hypothetical protein HYW76_03985 [Candidatus Pacearchaeota archaeon]|nr:hypothetical protein [Candidatus Pacearchaeota archaeon]